MDLKTADPREIVRGLMRGDRREFKLGYTAEGAVAGVTTLRPELTDAQLAELSDYAEGFADGLAEGRDAPDRVNPAKAGV